MQIIFCKDALEFFFPHCWMQFLNMPERMPFIPLCTFPPPKVAELFSTLNSNRCLICEIIELLIYPYCGVTKE